MRLPNIGTWIEGAGERERERERSIIKSVTVSLMKIIMKVLCLLQVVGLCAQELWQTIQAHNHNADLLKHHKEIETNSVAACLESTVESLTMVLEVPHYLENPSFHIEWVHYGNKMQ